MITPEHAARIQRQTEQVLALVCEARPDHEIADTLNITLTTVQKRIRDARIRYGVRSKVQLILAIAGKR